MVRKQKRASVGGFAPAFASKPKKPTSDDEEDNDYNQYEFMRRADVKLASTWNTFDPDLKQISKTGEPKAESEQEGEVNLKPGPWNNWGHGDHAREDANATGSSETAPTVNHLFVDIQKIMQHDTAPRTAFEARNQQALGLSQKSNKIVNMIGNQLISSVEDKTDERLSLMDREGRYVDGVWRGQPKKRLLQERERRIVQRDSEIEHACAVLKEWDSLTPDEQQDRLKKARRNADVMLELLTIDIQEGIPEAYTNEPSLFVESEDEDDYSTGLSEALTGTESLSQKRTRIEVAPSPSRQGALQLSPRREGLYDRAAPVPGARKRFQRALEFRQAKRASHTAGLRSLSATPTPQTSSSVGTRETSVGLPSQPRSYRPAVTPSAIEESLLADETIFSVTNWPLPVPYEDTNKELVPVGSYSEQELRRYRLLSDKCTRRPRLVAITLHSDVKFTSEAIVSRVFGGLIQEFQYDIRLKTIDRADMPSSRFFPDDSQALALFIHPADAAAFVTHVHAARRYSAHEYRRLQIAVDWHRGEQRQAVVKQTKNVTRLALFHSGSRVQCIDHIHQRIGHEDLLQIFRSRLANEGLIVRCRLIKPKHQSEREQEYCNRVILEFSSTFLSTLLILDPLDLTLTGIKQAACAKARFDNDSIQGFEQSTATFLGDPVCGPRASMPWCPCARCILREGTGPEGSTSHEPEGSVSGVASTVSTTTSRRSQIEGLRAAVKASRDGSMVYDPKRDAMSAGDYEERFYRRKDLSKRHV